MTDSLEGLSAELRKAVRIIRDCHDCGNSLCQDNSHTITTIKMLPADLAAQEMQRIKKVLKDKICLNKTFCGKKDKPELTMSGLVSIKNWHCRNCEKVEEAFGK